MFVFSPFSRALRRACTATGVVVALVAGTLAVASGQPASAASPGMVGLGTASSFAVLGGSAVANTGPSVINGDLGVSPGTSVTGFPPGNYTGTLHVDDGTARNAQADATTAYLDAAGRPFDQDLTGQNLGGKTLLPGVYEFASSAQLTGTLTLDAQGDPDAVFILQAGSTLTTASASRVVLTNGARACRVFWQLGTAATLGSNSTFVGTILAASAITMNSGANVYGALFTQSEAVTLDTNTVTPTCATAVPAITVSTSVAPASRPAPGGLFTYSVTVTNDSSGAVTLTSLIDDVYGNLDGVGSCTTGGTILAGESYVCAFARTFNGAAGEALTNTTTATVHDADNNPAVGADATTVLITAAPDPGPGVTVDKRASPSSRPEPGGSFTFAVSVTNTGINDTVLTVLDDDIYGDLDGQGTCATGGTILAGATSPVNVPTNEHV